MWGVYFLGLLGGFTAWVAIEYFARPLARFYAMRARAAEALARYENRQHSDQHCRWPARIGWWNENWLMWIAARSLPRSPFRTCLLLAYLPISIEKVSVLCAVCGIELAEYGGNRARYRGERILSCAGRRRLEASILA